MRASFSDSNDVTQTSKPVVETIVTAVARVESVDPVDLSEPVFRFVDPDALDALVASAPADTDLSVTFEAWDHEIEIDGDGTIRIDGEVQSRSAFDSVAGVTRGSHR